MIFLSCDNRRKKIHYFHPNIADLMDSGFVLPTKTFTTRYKCSACYKQYKKKEHLVEHMRISYHSVHQPRCAVCHKHFKSFESLIQLLVKKIPICIESHIYISGSIAETCNSKGQQAVAIECEMVGGGSDGSLDLCARVCLIDEDENIIFNTYVQPQIPVTNYRYEVTGLTEEHLRDAMPLKEVQNKILDVLYNGESVGKGRLDGGKARLLVVHSLDHDLECLKMFYPDHLVRDTANYRPLMKTNLVSHSLKYLTKAFLGYSSQSGVHDPYEDCVSVMRLYKRMRSQDHVVEGSGMQSTCRSFGSWKDRELEGMTPDELYNISRSDYRCWCLNSRKQPI